MGKFLIDEKLNQEFPEEVEIRENQDFDSEEEMTSETEETDDDESETNNANVNNYLDSANMVMNLETAMKIAEEEDLYIGDSGASSHLMGSEEQQEIDIWKREDSKWCSHEDAV